MYVVRKFVRWITIKCRSTEENYILVRLLRSYNTQKCDYAVLWIPFMLHLQVHKTAYSHQQMPVTAHKMQWDGAIDDISDSFSYKRTFYEKNPEICSMINFNSTLLSDRHEKKYCNQINYSQKE